MFYFTQIPARKSASIEIGYRGHQIQPCDAVLLLMAMSGCGISGTSVAFRLQGQVTGAEPQVRTYIHVHNVHVRACTYMYGYTLLIW